MLIQLFVCLSVLGVRFSSFMQTFNFRTFIPENGEPKLAAPVGLASSAEESEGRNISYTYTLWVGTNVTEAFSLSLISPKNTSFFRAMTQAADIDMRFAFEAREWPNGHYVHTLAGKKEEPRG